jgi:hypothetical protein
VPREGTSEAGWVETLAGAFMIQDYHSNQGLFNQNSGLFFRFIAKRALMPERRAAVKPRSMMGNVRF